MKPLKKIINHYMYKSSLISAALIMVLLVAVQLLTEQRQACDHAKQTFIKIEQVLNENQKELEEIRKEYNQTCLHKAETVARIIEGNSDVLEDIEDLKNIAEISEIDEIHIFDKTGRIFTGTHPEYYDFTFDSGEQIMFFKPMLENKKLKLVQDIMPNTAESKPMQYSAVWNSSGDFIVQVGMEPVNVMKVTEKNELSYIFSLFRINPDANYYAIDRESESIVGSSDTNVVGLKAEDIGLNMTAVKLDEDGFHCTINGQNSFCVFKNIGTNYIGRVETASKLYERIPFTILWVFLSLVAVALILAKTVVRHIEKYVIDEMQRINKKLQRISDGCLEERIDSRTSSDFSELSDHTNAMVESLIESNMRMSYVLDRSDLNIGTYEYINKSNKVKFTQHVPSILMMNGDRTVELSSDAEKFRKYVAELRKNSLPAEEHVYCIGERYVRIEEIESDNTVFGVVIDLTDGIMKRKQIERERDIDTLTGLYNRRALESQLTELFDAPEQLMHSAMILLDADGLKDINDNYGHEKGDIYLKKIAAVINNFGIKNSLASRIGGDEFVLFLYEYDSDSELERTIETLRYIQTNSTAHLGKDLIVPLSFSFGYCIVRDNYDYEQLIKEADEKMYADKQERKASRR